MAVAVAVAAVIVVIVIVVVLVVVKALYFIRQGEIAEAQWYEGIVRHGSEIDKARGKLYDKIKGTNRGESV